jgi:RHS repeat-associated protein
VNSIAYSSSYSSYASANTSSIENITRSYRYGFQGQEKDDEVKGAGNSVNYKYRMYDPRIARFFAVDPLADDYPYLTPFQFSSNQPIHAPELEGLESAAEIRAYMWSPWDGEYIYENSEASLDAAGNSGLIGMRDGLADAYRHTLWNALNTRDVPYDKAKNFADLHEEAAGDGDPQATKMDYYNNYYGRQLGVKCKGLTNDEVGEKVMQALQNGKLKVIRGDIFTFTMPSTGDVMRAFIATDDAGNPIIEANTDWDQGLTQAGFTTNNDLTLKKLVMSDETQFPTNGNVKDIEYEE